MTRWGFAGILYEISPRDIGLGQSDLGGHYINVKCKTMKSTLVTIIGSLLTVGLAVMFGLMGKPTEMGIIVVAGAIGLAFVNIDKIQRFKGAGFEAEMKRAVEEANATIEELREVATTSAQAILTDLMAGNFMDGTTLEKRLELHDQLVANLRDIGASQAQINKADDMWRRGIGIIFFRGIRAALEGRDKKSQINTNAEKHVLDASREFQELLNFKEWKTPSSKELREFCSSKDVMNPEVDELLKDYTEFEKSSTFRRRNVFVNL